jgi:hypothetical protein
VGERDGGWGRGEQNDASSLILSMVARHAEFSSSAQGKENKKRAGRNGETKKRYWSSFLY